MGLLDWAPKGFTLVSRGRLHGMQFGAKLLGLFEGIGSRLSLEFQVWIETVDCF